MSLGATSPQLLNTSRDSDFTTSLTGYISASLLCFGYYLFYLTFLNCVVSGHAPVAQQHLLCLLSPSLHSDHEAGFTPWFSGWDSVMYSWLALHLLVSLEYKWSMTFHHYPAYFGCFYVTVLIKRDLDKQTSL